MTTRTKATASISKVTSVHTTPPAEADATSATPVTTAASPVTVAPAIGFIAPPPAGATIPSVPDGFEPTDGTNYRGKEPRASELVALPLAIRDLANFVSYPQVIGATAPPLEEVRQTFDATNQWSSMRNASSAWDQYCRDQEGMAWTVVRAMMGRLKPAFALAVKSNPSIAVTYPGLASLLDARAVSAQKAAATRKRNKQEVAEGKAPTHGGVGKSLLRAAEKAALAAQNATVAPGAPVAGSRVSAPVSGSVGSTAAAPSSASDAAASVGSVAPAASGAAGGVSHS